MCSSRNGHMTKKSTVFYPTSAKYGTQSLLNDHMTTHYRRVATAKAAIDTSPPKTMKLHIKVQDRLRRERQRKLVEQSMSRSFGSRPQSSRSIGSRPQSSRSLVSEPPLEDINHNINMLDPRPNSAMTDIRIQSTNDPPSFSNLPRSSTPLSSHNRSRQRRPTPRKTATPEYKLSPYSPEPSMEHLEGISFQNSSNGIQLNPTTGPNGTLSVGKKSDEINNYTNITIDGYGRTESLREISWKTQNSYIDEKELQSSSEEIKRTQINDDNLVDYHKLDISPINRDADASRVPPLDGSMFNNQRISSRQLDNFEDDYEMKRFRKQEEVWRDEQKYLKFIEEVTTDVLSRGIFSDRVLNQVFETHIEKKKRDLNEDKMWSLIDELKNDLNLQDEEYEES